MCSTCFGHYYSHHQERATILLNYHIGRIVLGSMCVGVSLWLGWSGIRVAGFHFLCAQHVSDINISIITSLRLFCWINTLVVLFLFRCVLEFRCGWVGVVSVFQAFTSYVLNMFRTLIYLSSGAWDYSVELPHWSYCSWFDVCWSFGVVGLERYPYCRLSLLMCSTCFGH